MKDNVLDLLINCFHDFCDNKITFVYPNINENTIGDIKRFFNRPIDETIAFFCDTHKDDGKRNILITEKGIYDKFDYQMFAFLGLSLGKVNSISHDYHFSWEDINRVEFSEKKNDFFIYFDEGYDSYYIISKFDLLASFSFSTDQCTKLAYNLTQIASLHRNFTDKFNEILELESKNDLKPAIEKIDNLICTCNDSEEKIILKAVRGRLYWAYALETKDEEESNNLLETAINELKWSLDRVEDEEFEWHIHLFYGLALAHNGEDQRRIARKHFLLAMNDEDDEIVNAAKESYSACEQEMTDFWDNYIENVDYHDRKYIMPVKSIDGCADKNYNIETFRLDQIPKCIRFPIGHPIANQLYIGHPYNPSLYVPFEESEEIFFVDKVHELCYLLECLGAEEISITSIKGKNVNEINDSQGSYSGSADIKAFSGEVSGSKQFHQQGEMTSNNQRTMRIKLDPMRKPYLPEGLIWYNKQPEWQRIVNSRINGNMLEYNETVSTSKIKFTSDSEKKDIETSAKYLWVKAHAGVEQNIKTQFKETIETEWKVEVKFRSIKDLSNVTNNTPQIATQDTKLISTTQMTDNEQSYAEEVKFCLEDGDIGDKERKSLERMRIKLGISPERAAEIEASLQKPLLTEDEQEYLEVVKDQIIDGTIPESSRKILNRWRQRLNISEERASDIEKMI